MMGLKKKGSQTGLGWSSQRGAWCSSLSWRGRWGADHTGCWRPNKGFFIQLKENGKPNERLSKGGPVCNILVAGGVQVEGEPKWM